MTPAELLRRQKVAARLLEWACEGDKVDEFNDRYLEVCEYRDVGAMRKRYSSCGDLAQWLLYRLGVRLPWVNRKEHHGWTSGVNVWRLVTHSAHWRADQKPLDAGDIVVIANDWPKGSDAHVICIVADHGGGWYSTAEYGQPGGALCTRQVIDGRIGSRVCRTVLRLEDALTTAEAAGMLADIAPPKGLEL